MKLDEYRKLIANNKKDFALPMLFLEKSKFQESERLSKSIYVSFYNGKIIIEKPHKHIIRLL